jgi:DNA repair exonuclease SbcCD ATPase subunit/predicted phosphodiesterase
MRLATIADIHASQSNIEDTRRGMKEVNKLCDDHDVQWLIIAGDIFHDFNVGGKYESFGSVFDSINGPLNDFLAVDEKRKILMIPGNHDMPTEKGSKDALTSWEYNPKIHISREIELFKLDASLYVMTLPWMWSHQYKEKKHLLKRMEELKNHAESGRVMLVGHCEIEGTPFPSGYTMFGGNFSFTKNEINELRFSIVALGHIHKQDTWYVGAPWQHNFGECNLQGTMRIINTRGFQGMMENRIHPIPNTARYHVVNMDGDPDMWANTKKIIPKGDHVKVIGNKLTTALPKGWKFEKKKENYKAVARSTSDHGDSISAWLQKWIAEKKITANVADCLEIIKDVNIKGRYIHNRSLDSFSSIEIKGVGPHKDTKISFDEPIIAISGENGTGKTIFMESLFASLYGHLPSYGKINHISDKNASIEAIFRTDKDKYRVVRTINGEDKKAYVYKNDGKEVFIGPKISEVKKFMEKIIGPEELLLSSVFSTQFYAGDIVDLDPGNRKDIFNKLLGLENLAEVKEVIDNRFKALVKKKETLISQYGAMSTVEQLETAIVHNMKQLTENRGKINAGNLKRDALTNKNDLLTSEILSFSKELTAKINYENEMARYTKKMVDIKTCIASKQGEIAKREKFGDSKDLDSKLQGCEKVLNSFDAQFVRQKKDYEKKAKLTKTYNIKQGEYERAFQNIDNIIDKYSVAKKKIEEDKETIKDVGCRNISLPCKFIDNSKENIETEEDLDKVYNKTMKEEKTKLKQLKDEMEASYKKMNDFQVTVVDTVAYDDLKKEIEKLRNQIEDINNNQNLINIAKTELKSLKTQLDDAQKSHTTLYKKVAILFEVTQEKLDLLNNENSVQCKEIEDLEKEINDWTIKSTEHRKELEFSRNEIVKMQNYDKEISGLTTEIEKYEIVSKAFSKDGIPQLMIDCALPQLQDILNQLTSYIRKFDIKISTQQEQKNETLKETISFIVDDGIKQRDIKYFSGGEKKLLKTIVRLSLSLFQSQRSGNSYKLLFMDEAFDALDRDNSILLLRIIYNLKSKFNQIFIISHSTDILGNLSKCIRFEKDGERTVLK